MNEVTLRDYFAIRILAAAMDEIALNGHYAYQEQDAREAYKFADAMLKVRSERKDEPQ